MFCSNECFEHSMKHFHQYECSVMKELLKSASAAMSLRIFFMGLSIFEGSIVKLKVLFDDVSNLNSTIFDFDFSHKNSTKLLMYFKSFLGLSYSSKSFTLFQQKKILQNHNNLKYLWDEHQVFICKFLLRACQIADNNFHGIFSPSLNSNDLLVLKNLQQPIGTGAFLFCSLINHSCAQNVIRICLNGKNCVIVCRPIQKGSQIFDGYK